MLAQLKKIFFGEAKAERSMYADTLARIFRARYDAATTSDNNRRHWANADGLSANAAASPGVRRTLRNRARYEVANNSYAKGIVLTLANDVIGTGPRMQMLTSDAEANDRIETAFENWASAVNLPEKLRTMRLAKAEDGEAFAILTNNPALPTAVKLDLRLVEAEQVTTPFVLPPTPNAVDGILFDAHGNPTEYHVLKHHPGGMYVINAFEFDRIPARAMLHYFRAERPGQSRGIPEITPALPLFAMLRDYSLATLDAAKAAAYFSGILHTDAPANGEAESVEPMDSIELERNMLITMPGGWKMTQVHAEQPTGTYSEFKREILNEIARCLNMPFNVAACNSSSYNYASGRLDHQTYFKSIRVDQAQIETAVLDRILMAWLMEAVRIEGFLPQSARHISSDIGHQWFWDGQEHVDPAKEASAQEIRLRTGTTTLSDEYAKRGQDWETQGRQRVKEESLRVNLLQAELGMSRDQALAVVFASAAASADQGATENAN